MKYTFNLFLLLMILDYSNIHIIKDSPNNKPFCGDISFSSVAKEQYSGITKKHNLVISNQKELKKIWNECYSIQIPQPKCPEIDFEKEMVIGVFGGEFYSGGNQIEIINVKKHNGNVKILIKSISPGDNCITSSALTQPFHLIKMKKNKKNILFEEKKEITKCL